MREYHEFYTEQDAMIADLAHEHGVPYPIYPDLPGKAARLRGVRRSITGRRWSGARS